MNQVGGRALLGHPFQGIGISTLKRPGKTVLQKKQKARHTDSFLAMKSLCAGFFKFECQTELT